MRHFIEKNRTSLAILSGLIACMAWAGNFVLARSQYTLIEPFTLSFFRWLTAVVCILPFAYKPLKKDWKIVQQHWRYILCMGVIGVGGFNTLIYFAAHSTDVSHISILSSTIPVFTILIAALVKEEPLSIYSIFGAILAAIGALLVITQGNILMIFDMQIAAGDPLVIIAAIIWAGWSVALRFKPQKMQNITLISSAMICGMTALFPFFIVESMNDVVSVFNLKTFYVFLYVGIIASVMAWFLWQFAILELGSVRTGLLYYSIPLFSGILAWIFLDEEIHIYHLVSLLLVFMGVLVVYYPRKRNKISSARAK